MPSDAMNGLLQSVSTTISDYRRGQIPPMTPGHVAQWLGQFDKPDQFVILHELDSILKRLYFSRQRVKECLHRFLKNWIIDDLSPGPVLSRTAFLDIQTRGESQKALLRIIDEILRENYRTSLAACGTSGPETYVYIDDAVYTGSRLRHDLTGEGDDDAPAWITRTARSGCRLIIYALVGHLEGWNYALRYLGREAAVKGVVLQPLCRFLLDNRRRTGGKAQCLWPQASSLDAHAKYYLRRLDQRAAENDSSGNLFRDRDTPPKEALFHSSETRAIVEGAFLSTGAYLMKLCQVHQPHLRPLGFEVRDTLGFGTLVVTYRNIANNCPLALWWSELDHWYALFPRRVNTMSSESR